MLVDILLTLPAALLFLVLAARCLHLWGMPCPAGLRRFVPVPREGANLPPDSPYVPTRRTLLAVFCGALALRAVMLIAMAAATAFSNENGLNWGSFLSGFTLWDARHYLNLAEQGYVQYQEEGRHIFLVFYPLYVWVVRLFRLALPDQLLPGLTDTMLAGMLVSWFSYAWGCCWVYRLGARLRGKEVARSAVMFLSSFPFSFFFGTVMTEGLFLLTTAAALYFAVERRWLFYGVWGALAALTRMTGVLLIVPAVIFLLEDGKPLRPPVGQSLKKSVPWLLKTLPLTLTPLVGALGYFLLNWHVDGAPLAFTVHQAHWHQGGMWFSQVLEYLWHYAGGAAGQSTGWAIWLPELALFTLFFVVLALASWRREAHPGFLAYGFCYLIANYSLSWLLSAGRYMSCGVTFFLLLALLTEKRPLLRDLLLLSQAMLLGVYLFAYFSYAQIM